MTWTDLSGVFTYGTKLTSTQMQQLRDNITALANGDSGAPAIQTAAYDTASVDQGALDADCVGTSELKTGTSSGNRSLDGYSVMTGGLYSFYPQTYGVSLNSTAVTSVLYGTGNGSSYTTNIGLSGRSAGTMYWQNYYVTSSGERHWLFVLRDKSTGRVLAEQEGFDHPCYGNGGRPSLLRHPFGNIQKSGNKYRYIDRKSGTWRDCEVLIINPTQDQVKAIIKNQCVGKMIAKDFLISLHELYDIDELKTPKWDSSPVTVGLPRLDVTGKIIGDYRFAKCKMTPIKKSIAPPRVMQLAQLKDKP